MTRHLHRIILAVFLLGLAIKPDAWGVDRPVGKYGPSVVPHGNTMVNTELLLARTHKGVNRNLLIEKLTEINIRINREFTLVPGLMELAMPNQPLIKGEKAKLENLLRHRRNLRGLGFFKYIELDHVDMPFATVTDSGFVDGTLWALVNQGQNNGLNDADIDIGEAWDLSTGKPLVGETVVAVLDSGVRVTHNDLRSQIWINVDEVPNNGLDDDLDGYVDNYNGMDFTNDTGNPVDVIGHGTHVSGTIAATANDENPHVGVAFDAVILPCKLGDYGMYQSAQIKAIQFCVDQGVRIANCSFGGYGASQAVFDVMQKAGVDGDMIFLISAGNDSNNNDSLPVYPAGYDLECIVSVAATDRNDQLADFSNYGLTKVDLGAPGVDIYSSTSQNDQSYEYQDGTSMAAPHVAGVVALMRSSRPDWSFLEIREKLLESLDAIPALDGKTVTGGRLNAAKAVQGMGSFGAPNGIMEVSVNPPSGSLLITEEQISIVVTVIDGEKVENATVTMLGQGGDTAFFANDGEKPDEIEGDNKYTSYFRVPKEQGKIKMTLFVSCEGKNDLIRVLEYNIAAVPENDNFLFAEKIPLQNAIVESFNNFATVENGEPRHSGEAMHFGSLWWKWTAENSGPVYLDLAGSDIDANVAVYQGHEIKELIQIARNQNHTVENRDEGIYFDALGGKTYKFCVSSPFDEVRGYVRLRVAPEGKPDINRPSLSGITPFTGFISNTNKVEISGFAHDPVPNASGVKEVRLKINDGLFELAVGSEDWFKPIALQDGENIIELVALDYSDNISEVVRLQYDYFPPDLSNDHFVNALELNRDIVQLKAGQFKIPLTQGVGKVEDLVVKKDGVIMSGDMFKLEPDQQGMIQLIKPLERDSSFEVFNPFWATPTVSTLNATKEHLEPDHAKNEGGSSVWYKFEAPYDGVLQIEILEAAYDTLLGMYMGSSVDNLIEISSSDDAYKKGEIEFDTGISRLIQPLETGMAVYIAVDGYGGDTGNVAIRSSFPRDNIYRLFLEANGKGSIISPHQPFNDGGSGFSLHKENDKVSVEAQTVANADFFGWTGDVNISEKKFDLTISGQFRLRANFVEDRDVFTFEDWTGDDFRWSSQGTSSWGIDSGDPFAGHNSMRSGNLGDNNRSVLAFTGDFQAGELSFSLKCSTEEDWDRLRFYIDDTVVGSWSGLVDWKVVRFPITTGTHTIVWEYSKDFANSANLDSVWLDQINLPLSISASLKVVERDGEMVLLVKGEASHYYDVLRSLDLRTWDKKETVKLDISGEAKLNLGPAVSSRFYKINSR